MCRILIVDGDPAAAVGLARLLTSHGFETATAAGVAEAAGRVAAFRPHVVVTELLLPGASGAALAAWLRDLPAPRPRVVVVSGLTDFDDVREKLDSAAGVDAAFQKPVSGPDLAAAIRYLCGGEDGDGGRQPAPDTDGPGWSVADEEALRGSIGSEAGRNGERVVGRSLACRPTLPALSARSMIGPAGPAVGGGRGGGRFDTANAILGRLSGATGPVP